MAEITSGSIGGIGPATSGGVADEFAPQTRDGKPISESYRLYILILLGATYGLNMADRGILNVVMPVLKKDMHFHDWQIGILVGPVFAVVYSVCSIPFSSVADKFNRRNLISASMALFSGATLACGFALNYWQLAIGRFLTGSSEAATVPTANSIIADLYPPERRVSATSVFTAGGSAGGILAGVIGGYIAHNYGWREAFIAAGIPGVILAVVIALTAREPARLVSRKLAAARTSVSLLTVVKHLWSQKTFRWLAAAEVFLIFHNQGAGAFGSIFLVQTHGFNVAELGGYRLPFSIASIFVTLAVGKLIDRQSKKDLRWLMWCSAIVAVAAVPFSLGVYLSPNKWAAFLIGSIGMLFHIAYVAPMIATCQALVPNAMRARAIAILIMTANLLGMGLGPPFAGWLSDHLGSFMGEFEGLRWALIFMLIPNFISGYLYLRGAKTLRADHNRAREMDGLSPI